MFTSDDYSEVSVTIKGKYGNDINYTFSNDKYHLIPIYGLYADYNNTVIIKCEGSEKIINISTSSLPEDFLFSENMVSDNYSFYNNGYPYAIDSYGDVRWYLNEHFFGNVTLLDNGNVIVGSNEYNDEDSTLSFYRMNLLGKIYSEYLLDNGYYGVNTNFEGNIIVKSDKYLVMDLQTGNIIDELDEIDGGDTVNNIFDLYNGAINYTSLLKYSKYKENDIDIKIDMNRITVNNNGDDEVFIILDKMLDKRIYEVVDTKYINLEGLKGKYTIYYKINKKVFKTDYYVEV